MVDSTFTKKDLEAIERAIATGKKRVKYEALQKNLWVKSGIGNSPTV